MAKRKVYVVDGARTPFLKARGEPGPFSASDLAVAAGRAVFARSSIAPDMIDEAIVGCVIAAPDEANIARIIALRLGSGKKVPAFTVQRNCASGLQALASARERIALGYSDIILAGGTEAMSRSPIQWNSAMVGWLSQVMRARSLPARIRAIARIRPNYLKPIFTLLLGLSDPLVKLSMGQTAEIVAKRFGIKNMYILGSTSSTRAQEGSDIDLMINFSGNEKQKKELTVWLEGWSLCLDEVNYIKMHMISDRYMLTKVKQECRNSCLSFFL